MLRLKCEVGMYAIDLPCSDTKCRSDLLGWVLVSLTSTKYHPAVLEFTLVIIRTVCNGQSEMYIFNHNNDLFWSTVYSNKIVYVVIIHRSLTPDMYVTCSFKHD